MSSPQAHLETLPRSVQLAAALYRDDLVLRGARALEIAQPFAVADLNRD